MYQPQLLTAGDLETLKQQLKQEFATIAREQAQPSDYMALNTLYAAPKRIFDGQIVKADGTTWNPGSGAGVYARIGGAWVIQGAGSSSQAFPVGSIFTAVVSTSPATLLGYGTWTAFGAGKVLIGLDSGDADFDTAEETGGAKTKAISAHSGTAVADHASHTHTYTQVPNHTHPHNLQGGTTGATTGTNVMGSTATGGSARAMAIATSNPTGGVATATTNGPGATLTHSVTQPGAHTDLNVVQPYIVVYMWKRTA